MSANRPNRKSDPKQRLFAFLIAVLVIAAIYFVAPDVLVDLGIIEPVAGFSGTPAPDQTPGLTDAPGDAAVSGELRAYIIDVGQGDSILLISPSGKTMLVDAGESSSFPAIEALLTRMQIKTLDVVVATHPHSDHIGGMAKVINGYKIKEFYLPDVEHTTSTFTKMLQALSDQKVKVRRAQGTKNALISWDADVEVRVLSPLSGFEYKDLNAWSVILRVKFGDTAILLTGDAEAATEKIALNTLPAEYFRADVLKLGHHGSSTSTSETFLLAVSPEIAIASLGKDNDYGHPHKEITALLKKHGIALYRTDRSGTVEIVLDGSNVTVNTEK